MAAAETEGVPEIRFARSNASSIAYQIFGDGPVTIAAVPPLAQNIELAWEWPDIRRMLERFGSFSRYVHFDKRGTGMSDRGLDIPGLDERVDELRAVLDAEDIDRTYLYGASEGGPMAIMFAATYPDRVDGLILHATAADLSSDETRERIGRGENDEEKNAHLYEFAARWGTPESVFPDLFAPSLAGNDEFRSWHQRYERQAANRDALVPLLIMNAMMDVRGVLDRIDVPVLIVHRTGDPIVTIERGRDTYARLQEAGADVTMIELPGNDHILYAGDATAALDEMERFTTGRVTTRPARVRRRRVAISTMGGFDVTVDDVPVETAEWGSRRARTLLKRLVVARGWPVTRDELMEVLWPDESDPGRLGARLSVQLSAVRRVLHGGVVADRSSIRLDLDTVAVDIEDWFALDDEEAVDRYAPLLPDDVYDDWSTPLRDEMRDRFAAAARRLIDDAVAASDQGRIVELCRRMLAVDSYDEYAHRQLIAAMIADGRAGDARAAHEVYAAAMAELDVEPTTWDELAG